MVGFYDGGGRGRTARYLQMLHPWEIGLYDHDWASSPAGSLFSFVPANRLLPLSPPCPWLSV